MMFMIFEFQFDDFLDFELEMRVFEKVKHRCRVLCQIKTYSKRVIF